MLKKITLFFFLSHSILSIAQTLPDGFVYLHKIDKTIKIELRYLSNNNFIGSPIKGYKKNVLVLTKSTAIGLQQAQQQLLKLGLGLKVFDAYRPQEAVDHFVRWAKALNDTIMKKEYYPKVLKSELFQRGYIAEKSGHTRGSTVDLTIINLKSGKELDMGSSYDFFGKQSHVFYSRITNNQKKNRLLLRNTMLSHGFKPYEFEWWHFTLKNETFPNTYFNFSIE